MRVIYCICVSVLIGGLYPPSTAQAHGGVIINSGFTEQYEWLVAVDPFPAAAGETVVTFLIYDLETYAPINGLTGELYLAPPSSSAPCCNAEQHIGPLELETQPELYPGDYSTTVPLNEIGDWSMQFRLAGAEEPIDIGISVQVVPADPNAPSNTAINATREPTVSAADVVATATVFAQNVANARQANSASPASADGFTIPLLGDNWWLWGLLAIIPILMIAFGLLNRPPVDEWDDELDDEDDEWTADSAEDNDDVAEEAADAEDAAETQNTEE